MKLRISASILLAVLTIPTFANNTSVTSPTGTTSGRFYIGAFGGNASSNKFNASQFGTAFFPEISGGPLSVNAFGQLNSESGSFFGVQLGYQTPEILLKPSSQWTLGPAAELEGYSMSNKSFYGILNNNTARLPEHDFTVSYPMSRSIFLANAVLNLNNSRFPIHPYVGFGIGNAIIRISGADSTQVRPAEEGVNHYNANSSDTNSTFAGQVKLGLSFDINNYLSVFADYRWLYLASTHYTFGSTVYPTHAETSSWQVKLDAQKYNLGNIGLRIKI